MAYADVYDLMKMTEELVSGLVKHVHGSYVTKYHTSKGEELEINWEGPWRRIDMIPGLEEATGEKFPTGDVLHTPETGEFLKKVLAKTGVECNPPLTNARMLDALCGEFLESQCVSTSVFLSLSRYVLTHLQISPTFIFGHPKMMSPLAKSHRSIPGLCERFECFVATKEICNA